MYAKKRASADYVLNQSNCSVTIACKLGDTLFVPMLPENVAAAHTVPHSLAKPACDGRHVGAHDHLA
jgi:hypothetical protein